MSNIHYFFDRLFHLLPGYYFGIITFSAGFLNISIALFLSPMYDMWVESVSVLLQNEGGIFLRIGLILSMLFAIPFVVYVGRILTDNGLSDDLRTITVSTGIFSSMFIILSATFSGGVPFISSLHSIFTLLSWLGILVFFMLHAILLVRSLKISRSQIMLSFTLTAICVFYLTMLLTGNFCNFSTVKCKPYNEIISIIVPIMEWITTFSIFLWFLGTSIVLFYKGKSKY